MNQADKQNPDELRPEYDFSQGVRGKHYQAYRAGTNVVLLDRLTVGLPRRSSRRAARDGKPSRESDPARLAAERRSIDGATVKSTLVEDLLWVYRRVYYRLMNRAAVLVGARLAHAFVVQPLGRGALAAILAGFKRREPRFARAFDERGDGAEQRILG